MTRIALLAATTLTALSGLAQAQPVSGLYIGGAGGANFLQRERVDSFTQGNTKFIGNGSIGSKVGVAGVGSLGYGFGNGLRLEVEGDYRYNRRGDERAAGGVSVGGREQKYGGMVNALFDLDVGSPYVFPYIGAGAGYSWIARRDRSTGAFSFLQPNGSVLSGTNASVSTGGTDSAFAYQAIAGLSFPIPPVVGLSLTAEYRYFALAGDREFTQTITGAGPAFSRRVKLTDNYNHSLMLGLRYAFNVAPPAVEPPATPVRSEAARTYLVFFDWDRADLTTRARQIVAEAAQATTRIAVTRIEVAGHTDTSGTPRYNEGLSQRRAAVVAAELVRLGVPRAAITTQAYGQSRPLVPTAAGVREPQNRRVEIVLR